MKNFKKLTAAVAATLMAATMVAPMAMNTFAATKSEYANGYSFSESDLNSVGVTAFSNWKAEDAVNNTNFSDWLDNVGATDSYFKSLNFDLALPDDTAIDKVTDVKVYKLFDIKKAASGYEISGNDAWGENDPVQTLVTNALNAANGLTGENAKTYAKPSAALAAISELGANDSTKAIAFAKALQKALDVTSPVLTAETGCSYDAATKKVKFDSAPADGYYVVLATGVKINGSEDNTTNGETDDEKTSSLAMLTVINGDVDDIGSTGVAKVGLPKVEKKVLEDDNTAANGATYEDKTNPDKHWNDVADLEIGQDAKFRLYGTLPENYDMYDNYYYCFNDTLDAEFVAPDIKTFVIDINGTKIYGEAQASVTNANVLTGSDGSYKYELKETVDGEEKTKATVTVTISTKTTGEKTITVTISNVKAFISDTDFKGISGAPIKVDYTTALNASAKVGSEGNQKNAVTLTYSNNPNKSGAGEYDTITEDTPEDTVEVFTYDFVIDKTFFAGSELTQEEIAKNTYGDFEFTVNGKQLDTSNGDYDYVITGDTDKGNKTEITTDDTDTGMTLKVYDKKGNRLTASASPDSNGNYTFSYTKDEVTYTYTYDEDAKTWTKTGGNDGPQTGEILYLKIKVKGVDSGKYTVGEDQTARNNKTGNIVKYNDVADKTVVLEKKQCSINGGDLGDIGTDVNIYNNDGTLYDKLTVSLKVDNTDSSAVAFENRAGTELPTTGGIGTTLFYLGGGAMVAVAGIFLITKKRMSKNEG